MYEIKKLNLYIKHSFHEYDIFFIDQQEKVGRYSKIV